MRLSRNTKIDLIKENNVESLSKTVIILLESSDQSG